MVKNLPDNAGDAIQSLGQEDPLEEGLATSPVFLPGESHGQRSLAGRCSYQVLPELEEAALKASWYMCDGGSRGGGAGKRQPGGWKEGTPGRRPSLGKGQEG